MTGLPRIFSSASANRPCRKIGLAAGRKRHDHGDIARRPWPLRECGVRQRGLRQRQRGGNFQKLTSVHRLVSPRGFLVVECSVAESVDIAIATRTQASFDIIFPASSPSQNAAPENPPIPRRGRTGTAGRRHQMHRTLGLLPAFQDHLDLARRDGVADDESGRSAMPNPASSAGIRASPLLTRSGPAGRTLACSPAALV